MFQRIRRNRGSYLYLPENAESKYLGGIEPTKLLSEEPKQISQRMLIHEVSNETPRESVATSNESNSDNEMTLDSVLMPHTQFTSWPSSIWEINFENCETEIVFDWPDSDIDSRIIDDSASKMSVGTLETEEETLPSPGPSPSYQNTWELEDLDLSTVECEPESEVGSPATNSEYEENLDISCSHLVCRDLRNDFIGANRESSYQQLTGNSAELVFDSSIAEESYDNQQAPVQSEVLSYRYRRKRTIRFADEEGREMHTIHLVENDDGNDARLQRVLILIMLPKLKQYEFVHAEYSIESRIPVSSLIKKLPSMVSGPQITKQRYIGLCHAAGGSVLDNALAIQDSGLASDDILVAVPKGYSGSDMYELAKGLLADEKLLKAVKQTNRSAHVLHRLHSIEVLSDAHSRPDSERSMFHEREPTKSVDNSAKHVDHHFIAKPAKFKRSETSRIFEYVCYGAKLHKLIFQESDNALRRGAADIAMVDRDGQIADYDPFATPLNPGESARENPPLDSHDPCGIGDYAKTIRLFGRTLFQKRVSNEGEHLTQKLYEGHQSSHKSKAKWTSRLAKKLKRISKRKW